MDIMEVDNPPTIRSWPYVVTIIMIPALSIVGCVVIAVVRPEKDNVSLITQILGYGVTIMMATLAYLKSSDTHAVVNSRMDEFKRTLMSASNAQAIVARAEGKAEGRDAANDRTDALATKSDAIHESIKETVQVMKTHDQWERDRVAQEELKGKTR